MRRLRNWDVAATIWACDQIGKPFVWGDTDCGSLVRGMVTVMYGVDFWPDLSYGTLREAVVELNNGGTVLDRLLAIGASPLAGVAYAGTGDVVISPPVEDGDDHDLFPLILPVITDKLLVTAGGDSVQTVPLTWVPAEAVAYRLPHG